MKNAIVQIFIPAKGWEQESHLNWQSEEVINYLSSFHRYTQKELMLSIFLFLKQKYFLNTLPGKDFNYLKMNG